MSDSKDSLTWVSSTEQGRRFIWDMLAYCGVYHDMAGEPNDVFKQLGKREVGLHLLGLLADIDDEIIFNMMREAKTRNIQQEIKNDNASNDTSGRDSSSRNSSDINDLDAFFLGSHTGEPANI